MDHSLSSAPVYDHGEPDQHPTDATLANTATDSNLTGSSMANIRSANRRHKRALVSVQTRKKLAEQALVANAKPTKAAR